MSLETSLKTKLHSVYSEIEAVVKGGTNKGQNYKYVRAVDVTEAVREVLTKIRVYAEINFEFVGEAYTIARAKEKDAPFTAVNVRCTIVFHDLDSDATFTTSALGTGADTGDKAVYKAQTGCLKYALKNAFLIPETDKTMEPEGDPTVDEPTSFDDIRDSRPAPRPTRPSPASAAPAQPASQPTVSGSSTSATPKASSAATTAAAPSTPSAANAQAAATDFPTEKQLEAYRAQFKKLGDDLAADGGLKASKGLPINRKLLVFLLRSTGADKAEAITNVLWLKFFAEAEHVKAVAGLAALAELVNVANGITTEKK